VSEQPLDQRERLELCDLFLELGPDAPTLCEGWTTADLAAHLVVRERDPRSMPGIISSKKRWRDYTKSLMDRQKAKGYEATVERVRSGPPLFPGRIPGVRTLMNLNEYFVHHEDVRRANGRARRTDRPDLDDALWKVLGRAAKFTTRKVKPNGLVLRRPNGDQVVAQNGEPLAVLTGEPSEIALYLVGRDGAAQVELNGDPQAVATIERTSFGI
jgi:uncharacterized protein (TIGR03085 family)